VKLLTQDKELYVLVEAEDRLKKERAMRLSKLWPLLKRLRQVEATDTTQPAGENDGN